MRSPTFLWTSAGISGLPDWSQTVKEWSRAEAAKQGVQGAGIDASGAPRLEGVAEPGDGLTQGGGSAARLATMLDDHGRDYRRTARRVVAR